MRSQTIRTLLSCVLPSLAFLYFVYPSTTYAQTSVVSGIVSEAASGEAVIGVNVILSKDETGASSAAVVRGARTNKFGFYSLSSVPQGYYFIIVRGIGYKTLVRKVTIEGTSLRENILLATQNVRSQEITVESARDASPTQSISSVQISTDFIKKMPAFGGEVDVFRVLQLLPGIKSGGELSSGLYIRGGSPDQNLVLLDGVTVYNPTHLGGFLSTFNGDAIRDVRVIKGAFPAEYGGRLSSVIDLTMKEGSKEKIGGTANISLLASRLTVEGPITEDITFMVSGRRTYLDLLTKIFAPGTPDYYFYDLNAKVNYRASDNDRIFLSGYFGQDVLSATEGIPITFGVNWGNATGNLRWMHVVSPSLFTNFSLIYTDYRSASNLSTTNTNIPFYSQSRVRDFVVRGEAQWFPDQQHTIKAGIDAIYHNFHSIVSSDDADFNRALQDPSSGANGIVNGIEASAYIQDEWNEVLGINGLSINAGIRLSYFQLGNRLLPEPRFSFVYNAGSTFWGGDFRIKGAFAVANQFLHLVSRNDITLPMSDTWFPATETIAPSNSVQYVLGAETTVFNNEVLVSVEGYYKSMQNLLDYRDNAVFSAFQPPTKELTVGTGESYGVEVFINKRVGDFTGWIGYTLAWTQRQFAELNNGKPFSPRYDIRHDVSVVGTYRINEAWEVGATWTFNTGLAYTMPAGVYYFNPNTVYYPASLSPLQPSRGGSVTVSGYNRSLNSHFTMRNGFNLPSFHKLDLNFTHFFSWFGLPFNLSLNVYNTYNRQNPFAWAIRTNSAGKPEIWQSSLFPILPTFGIGFKF